MQQFSYAELYAVIEWEAKKAGVVPEAYVHGILDQIKEHQAALDKIAQQLRTLSESDRRFVLGQLSDPEPSRQGWDNTQKPAGEKRVFSLEELVNEDVSELVKRKPEALSINGTIREVDSWTGASLVFVAYLVQNGLLKKQDLPLCPNPRSPKAYVNFYPGQPAGVRESGIFRDAGDGFFVDIKHNAKYHLLNMLRSLEKLGLQDRCKIAITI